MSVHTEWYFNVNGAGINACTCAHASYRLVVTAEHMDVAFFVCTQLAGSLAEMSG